MIDGYYVFNGILKGKKIINNIIKIKKILIKKDVKTM